MNKPFMTYKEEAESLRDQLASRDTKIAELKNQLLANNPLLDEAADKIDELMADNARLREALIGYHSVASGVLGVPSIAECAKKASSVLSATPEQSLAEYRNKLIEQMIACYSPDDSAHDYFDKLNALKDQK